MSNHKANLVRVAVNLSKPWFTDILTRIRDPHTTDRVTREDLDQLHAVLVDALDVVNANRDRL